MILSIPDFPPLDGQGKPPRPIVMLLGRGGWQGRTAASISPSCGCVVTTDVLQGERLRTPQWIAAVLNYIDMVDVIGLWAGTNGFYLDEWTMAAYILGRRPGVVIAGADPEPEHPMVPGMVHILAECIPHVFSRQEHFVAALRERARNRRS